MPNANIRHTWKADITISVMAAQSGSNISRSLTKVVDMCPSNDDDRRRWYSTHSSLGVCEKVVRGNEVCSEVGRFVVHYTSTLEVVCSVSEPDARCIRRRRVAYAVLRIQLDLLLLGRPTIVGRSYISPLYFSSNGLSAPREKYVTGWSLPLALDSYILP